MIIDYDSRKNEALASYNTMEECMDALSAYTKKMELQDLAKPFNTVLGNIRKKVDKIKHDRFKIMVVGEAKSGKSTFINAYLGTELLPMDVKQCTSTIVEIKYGEKFSVKAIYADGNEKEVTEVNKARDFLQKNAALDEAYRGIPVPAINDRFLIKAGLHACNNGTDIAIDQAEVEAMLSEPEIQNSNIYNLIDYDERIKAYVETHKDKWKNIITKIEVRFPLEKELRGVEIIDSPGVYAYGGAGDITLQYIKNADAVIFLKPISGQALEAMQFNQFMTSVSKVCNKSAVFLVLTRAADMNINDLRRLAEEAYKQFAQLDKNHILIVDSKAELYAKKFSEVDNIKDELDRLADAGSMDSFLASIYVDLLRKFDCIDVEDFCERLREESRFVQIHRALGDLRQKSRYILLHDLMKSINEVYARLLRDLDSCIDAYQKNDKDPEEFRKKIAELKQAIEMLQYKKSNDVCRLVNSFNGDNGVARKEAAKNLNNGIKSMKIIDASVTSPFYELERLALQASRQMQELNDELQARVIETFNNELTVLDGEGKIALKPLEAIFAKESFNKIKGSTFSRAYETQSCCVYIEQKHLEIIRNIICTHLRKMRDDLINNVECFVNEVAKRYAVELSKNIDMKKAEVHVVENKKAEAEKIREIINEFSVKKVQIELARNNVEKLQGGLSCLL